MPDCWKQCPTAWLEAATLLQAAVCTRAQMVRSASVWRFLTVDGVEKVNTSSLPLLSWCTVDSNGKLVSALNVLAQAEAGPDMRFATEDALPMFYGQLLGWLAGVGADGADVLQNALQRLVTCWCSGGPWDTHVSLCWWHAVLKLCLQTYASAATKDDGLGEQGLAWFSLIIWSSVSTFEANQAYAELLDWVTEHPSGNTDTFMVFLTTAWGRRAKLMLCARADSPVGDTKGTYNEVYNYTIKSWIGPKGAAGLAILARALQASSQAAVSNCGDLELPSL